MEHFRARLARLSAATADRNQPSPYRCDYCQDTGWKSVDVDGISRVTRCACIPSPTFAEGVPAEFQGATLTNYESQPGNEAALARARAFWDSTRDLLLVGGVGAGKTRLACSIANARPLEALFVRVPMMLHQLEPGNDDGRRVFERRLLTIPVLVLDDLGAERDMATDFTRRTLHILYEARHDAGLRNITTSNKTLDELAAMNEDSRLASRIGQWADVVLVRCEDQRLAYRPHAVAPSAAPKGRS
jgi:DNA replication protein DnaC